MGWILTYDSGDASLLILVLCSSLYLKAYHEGMCPVGQGSLLDPVVLHVTHGCLDVKPLAVIMLSAWTMFETVIYPCAVEGHGQHQIYCNGNRS